MVTLQLLQQMVSWRAVLDILFLAVLIFVLYRALLRLGTYKILTGILIAAALFIIANLLDLTGIEWIYANVSQVAVIALIVIFQPELRKILERAASVRRTDSGDRMADISGLVSNVLLALSKQKRGALLIIPGKEPLQEWLTGGHILDAAPSYPLLMSIFDPNSPGHDGALIIENGRCTRFGVRLPVSKTAKLSEEYGTRHHAAMGLAEVSDALVLVVSEERGSITLFKQDKYTLLSDRSVIVDAIRSHWKTTAAYPFEMRKGLPRWLLAPQVLISLLAAIGLWAGLTFARGELLERVVSVPVEYTAIPESLALVGDRVTQAKLYLYGPKAELNALLPAQLSIKVDMSGAKPGTQTFFITQETIRLPKQIQLVDAEPASFKLTLAQIVIREMTVKPQLVGRLPAGQTLKSVKVFPEKILVTLPSAAGEPAVTSVTTTPVYLETIRETTTILCKIIAPPNIQPVEKRWPDVEVTVDVGLQK
jgi:uncharacterized protein (TIGR00159 family)